MKITRHHLGVRRKTYEKLLNLKKHQLERYRIASNYGEKRKIIINAPLPECKGIAWRHYPEDYLILVGIDENGNEKKIPMGLFSNEKAKTILLFINEITPKSE